MDGRAARPMDGRAAAGAGRVETGCVPPRWPCPPRRQDRRRAACFSVGQCGLAGANVPDAGDEAGVTDNSEQATGSTSAIVTSPVRKNPDQSMNRRARSLGSTRPPSRRIQASTDPLSNMPPG